MPATRTISSLFSLHLLRAATRSGLAANAVDGILPEPLDPDDPRPIPEATHLALWAQVMRSLDDPGFPIAYARTMSIDDYGLLGLACKTAPTLAVALDDVRRYLSIYSDLVSLTPAHDRGVVILERPGAATLGHRCSVESAIGELVSAMRDIAGAPFSPSAVTFAHPEPRDISAHVDHFGVRPRFGAAVHSVELDPAWLRRPVARSDDALHRYLSGELEKLRATTRATDRWAERTRKEALRRLPHVVEISQVARALGTSVRTLQRRLRQEQRGFEEIVDGARRELAHALLADTSRTVTEVAHACGFTEGSSFTRAYRRWTGQSPRAGRTR